MLSCEIYILSENDMYNKLYTKEIFHDYIWFYTFKIWIHYWYGYGFNRNNLGNVCSNLIIHLKENIIMFYNQERNLKVYIYNYSHKLIWN